MEPAVPNILPISAGSIKKGIKERLMVRGNSPMVILKILVLTKNPNKLTIKKPDTSLVSVLDLC